VDSLSIDCISPEEMLYRHRRQRGMKGKTIFKIIEVIILAVMLFPSMGQTAPYYEGKRVTILVGFTPGGGHDRIL
jgi:hypothetical protein